MTKHELAEWMHNEYELLAKAENWQTQEITRVKFEDLPAENKSTMLALADKMLNTFKIISLNPVLAAVPDVDLGHGKCVRCKQSWATTDYNGYGHWVCDHCDRMLENEFEDEYR